MRKKFRILLTGLLLVGLVVVAWKPFHLGEPWYRWRSLSSWLEVYGPGPRGYKPSPKADEALRHIGTNAVPHLLRRLHATNKMVQHNAINFLGRFGPEAKAAVPKLVTLTTDQDSSVRENAFRALEKIEPSH